MLLHAEVYDIMAANELDPRMAELGMSAIIMEAPSYSLQDWIPYGDHDPAGAPPSYLIMWSPTSSPVQALFT